MKFIDKSTYRSVKPVHSRSDILCRFGKVHKETHNGLPPLCPILLPIDTPTYIVAKLLLKFLKPSTANEYTVIDSFHFAEEIFQQDANLHMAGLEVDSSFTNIPHIGLYIDGLSIFVLTTYTIVARIPLTSPSMIFVICLT